MSVIADMPNSWRGILLSEPASFRGVEFHVEAGTRTSGRRTVVHEYPKRWDDVNGGLPYSEDMGRHARRFTFTGYLVYRPRIYRDVDDYVTQRKRLYEALEKEDAGRLVHPVFAPGGMLAICERYSMSETRERGGYTAFEMSFVEAGKAVSALGNAVNTNANVKSQAQIAIDSVSQLIPADL